MLGCDLLCYVLHLAFGWCDETLDSGDEVRAVSVPVQEKQSGEQLHAKFVGRSQINML
jgi:hypothetical protein